MKKSGQASRERELVGKGHGQSRASVGWIFHPFFRHHRTGPEHPEQPARMDAIVDALAEAGLLDRLNPLDFGPATLADLGLVHDPAYADLVRLACEQGFAYIGDPETHLCPESYDVATLAAGGVLAACDAVLAGRVRRAFCAVRPPGHHAERDRAWGFCLFNHVALAAEHLVRRRGLSRVAIVDFDVHHGNGTQALFAERSDVLYLSLHENPLTLRFPGTGYRGEQGSGRGEGFSVNVLIPPGGDEADYRRAWAEAAGPALDGFAPQFLLLSAGFDAHCTESVAHVNLTPGGFGWLTRELVAVAERHAAGRLVSVLEGGYELEGLGRCAAAHVAGLLGDE